MRPISVCESVAVTTAIPAPSTTSVPAWTMSVRSETSTPSETVAASLCTGSDSPVRTDSSVERLLTSMMRASAGMRCPYATWMMSPGTRSAESISSLAPISHGARSFARTCLISRARFRREIPVVETEPGIDEDREEDDRGVDPFPEENGERRRHDEDENERRGELLRKKPGKREALFAHERVLAKVLQAECDFFSGKAFARRLKCAQRFVGRERPRRENISIFHPRNYTVYVPLGREFAVSEARWPAGARRALHDALFLRLDREREPCSLSW